MVDLESLINTSLQVSGLWEEAGGNQCKHGENQELTREDEEYKSISPDHKFYEFIN